LNIIFSCQTSTPVKYALKNEKAIFYAVHEFAFSKKDTNAILDEMNDAIWKASREVI
jgi:hypothetical protein